MTLPRPDEVPAALQPGDGLRPVAIRVLLLLDDPGLLDEIAQVLRENDPSCALVKAHTLDDAMVASSASPVDLAVLDPVLCESLEREFIGHLLNASPRTRVMLTAELPASARRVLQGRTATVRPEGLVQAVRQWQQAAHPAAGPATDAGVSP